jgi:hypothetical protein
VAFLDDECGTSLHMARAPHSESVLDDCAVIMFANDDPLPMAFNSLASAAGYIEVIDVENGLYGDLDVETGIRGAVYAIDGRDVEGRAIDSAVSLVLTPRRDHTGLQQRLLEVAEQGLVTGDPADPAAIAHELLEQRWNARWPKRPRWMNRRLHGDIPPSV